MKNVNPFRIGFVATLGLGALLLGVAGASPARADDWDGNARNHIYRDVQDVRRDESILRDLEYQRDEARRCRNWSEARSLDRRISDLRRHIDRDRRDIHRDVNRVRDDRYRDDYRNTDYRSTDYRSRDNTRYRTSDRYDDTRYRR